MNDVDNFNSEICLALETNCLYHLFDQTNGKHQNRLLPILNNIFDH